MFGEHHIGLRVGRHGNYHSAVRIETRYYRFLVEWLNTLSLLRPVRNVVKASWPPTHGAAG